MDLKEEFRKTSIIYYALFAGQLVFCAAVVVLQASLGYFNGGTLPFNLVVPLITMSAIFASVFLYTSRLNDLEKLSGNDKKFEHYRTSQIIRWALIEGGNLFPIVIFLLEPDYYYLAFFLFGILAFFSARPDYEKFTRLYKIQS